MSERTPADIAVDLQRLSKELTPKELRRGLRRAYATEARKMRRKAVSALLRTKIHNAKAIGKTVRSGVTKDLSSIYVSASFNARTRRGMYRNGKGKLKPVAYWVNSGTTDRKQKRNHVSSYTTTTGRTVRAYTRKGHDTGETAAHNYMANAEAERPAVERRLTKTLVEKLEKIAARHNR